MASKTQQQTKKPAPAPVKGKTQAAPPPKASVPAVRKQQEMVAQGESYETDMMNEMSGDAGRGVSTAANDNIVPLIYVLQSQSPQALRQKTEFIPGAQAGMFWMRGTKEVVDGEEGLPVVIVHLNVVWVEWRPNRGGLVGRHASKPANAVQKALDAQKPDRLSWVLPNGNVVVETREHAIIRVDTGDAYVIPLSGSNHGAARQLMTSINRKKIPGTDLKAAVYGYQWRMKTIAKTNDDGDWFGIMFEEEMDEAGENQLLTWNIDGGKTYKFARQLNEDFESGRKVSDQGDESELGGGEDSDDGDGEGTGKSF
jgi:hypothetical protein